MSTQIVKIHPLKNPTAAQQKFPKCLGVLSSSNAFTRALPFCEGCPRNYGIPTPDFTIFEGFQILLDNPPTFPRTGNATNEINILQDWEDQSEVFV